MKVTFRNVIDRAYTTLFTNYKVDNLLKMDEASYTGFLSNFLVNSIDMFNGCLDDLSYHEETTELDDGSTKIEYVFDKELTSKEVYILSLGIAMGIYKKEMDDVTQYRLHMSNKEFKAYSEASNLQKRLERYGAMQEELDEEITQYQLNNIDKLPFFGGA